MGQFSSILLYLEQSKFFACNSKLFNIKRFPNHKFFQPGLSNNSLFIYYFNCYLFSLVSPVQYYYFKEVFSRKIRTDWISYQSLALISQSLKMLFLDEIWFKILCKAGIYRKFMFSQKIEKNVHTIWY